MKKIIILATIFLFLSAGTIFAIQYFYPEECEKCGLENQATIQPEQNEPLLGGDSDEHGCIGSAGYSWCQFKEKCLRIWEEPCGDDVNFVKSGVIAKNNPGQEKDKLYLVYEEPGKPALSVILDFDSQSICGDSQNQIPCMALSVGDYGLTSGQPVLITGVKDGNIVSVREIRKEIQQQ